MEREEEGTHWREPVVLVAELMDSVWCQSQLQRVNNVDTEKVELKLVEMAELEQCGWCDPKEEP